MSLSKSTGQRSLERQLAPALLDVHQRVRKMIDSQHRRLPSRTTVSAAGWDKQLMRAVFCLGSLGLDADMAWIPASDPYRITGRPASGWALTMA